MDKSWIEASPVDSTPRPGFRMGWRAKLAILPIFTQFQRRCFIPLDSADQGLQADLLYSEM